MCFELGLSCRACPIWCLVVVLNINVAQLSQLLQHLSPFLKHGFLAFIALKDHLWWMIAALCDIADMSVVEMGQTALSMLYLGLEELIVDVSGDCWSGCWWDVNISTLVMPFLIVFWRVSLRRCNIGCGRWRLIILVLLLLNSLLLSCCQGGWLIFRSTISRRWVLIFCEIARIFIGRTTRTCLHSIVLYLR